MSNDGEYSNSTGMDSGVVDNNRRTAVKRRLNFDDPIPEDITVGAESGEQVSTTGMSGPNSNPEEVLRFLDQGTREKFSALAQQFRDTYQMSTRKYIADVFIPYDDKFNNKAIGYLAQRADQHSTGFFGFVGEFDHIHVIHDCSYSGRSCRCRFREILQAMGYFKKHERFIRNISNLEYIDWIRIFIYYFLSKRGPKALSSEFDTIRLHLDSEHLQERESIHEWAKEFRREQNIRSFSNKFIQDIESNENSRSANDSIDGGIYEIESGGHEFHGKKTKRVSIWDKIRGKVYAILERNHIAPLSTIFSIPEFKRDSILTNPKNKSYVESACELYADDLCNYSMRDFKELLLRSKNDIFFKGVKYHSPEESLDILDKLLKFQYDDDEGLIKHFLNEMMDILDKRYPKKNTLVIYSPDQCAGKNFIVDMIRAVVIVSGQFGVGNKNNNFPFHEAPNKRVNIWDEPNYEPMLDEQVKKLTAGDPCMVRVKCRGDQFVARTPMIVMTNKKKLFIIDRLYQSRIRVFDWKSAWWLKTIPFKPHPLAFFQLLDKYNIEY